MARARSSGNGESKLEEAMALLINNQAAFVGQQLAITKQIAETDRINSERFARIEATLAEHTRILIDVVLRLQTMEQAIREKIGFKPA